MATLSDYLANPTLVGPLVVFISYALLSNLFARSPVPHNLPWIGRDPSKLFSKKRAALGSFSNARQYLQEGYEKYAKKGKSYIFPDFSGHPEIIVPRSSMQWLLEQPDQVLSTSEFHRDTLLGDYNFTHKHLLEDPWHEHVIHRSLARHIQPLIMDMWDELGHAMDETWGTDTTTWKEITVMENLMVLIARASNRMFVGLPLCRNMDYLTNMGKFAWDVILNMQLIQFVPKPLWPIFGRLLGTRNSWHYWKTTKYTLPVIKKRLAEFEQKRDDTTFDWTEPNDYLSWHIKMAMAENNTVEIDPVMISRRLMPLNFAAIHTTMLSMTNTLLDMLSSDPSKGVVAGIQEEVERVYAECDGVWTKASLAKLIRTDSAIRESMRVNNFMTRGIMRKVMQPGGIVNNAEGWSAPQGAYIGLDVHSVQHDPEIYPNPNEYDAFRFSRPREGFDKLSDKEKDESELLKLKNMGMITTGGSFLPFGHGRHACPGRFFVSHELKMLIAYMLLNYEVEPLLERPPNKWFGQSVVPPARQTIRVRRKTLAPIKA